MADGLQQVQLRIDSILGGMAPTFHLSGADQFLDSVAIDPEFVNSATKRPSMNIMPTRYQRVLTLDSEAPMWISGAQTTTGVFVYGSGGTLYALSSALVPDPEGGLVQPTAGAGNGMVVYNDYVYMATATDIYRFGPLSATAPTLSADGYWRSSSGFGQAAMTDTEYPGIRNLEYPNHPMHFHNNGKVYMGDYDGEGLIHVFETTATGTGSTATFAKLRLPTGYLPMDIESYGTDLAILATPRQTFSSGAIPRPGVDSALFLWDAIDRTYYRSVPIKEAVATALVNKNGELYVVAGKMDAGVRLLKYLGGDSFQVLDSKDAGSPPPAGAFDAVGNSVTWGSYTDILASGACLYSHGYRSGKLPGNSVNSIAKARETGTNPIISSVKLVTNERYPLIGVRSDTGFGVDSVGGSGAFDSGFQTKVFNIGNEFRIRRIRFPLTAAVSSGVIINVSIITDNFTTTHTLDQINNTDHSGLQLIDFRDIDTRGFSNFFLQFTFTGTTQVGIALPILIDVDIYEQ